MKRKLVKQGQKSLVVTIPTSWLERNHLKKGDDIELEERQRNIIISPTTMTAEKKQPYFLDVTDKDHFYTMRKLTMLYRLGYDEIHISSANKYITHLKKRKQISLKQFLSELTPRFIGMEIISEKETVIILKCFTAFSKEETQGIQRRIFLLLKEFMEKINNKETFEEQEAHDQVVKFINYHLRILHLDLDLHYKEKQLLYSFFTIQDKISDCLRHCAQEVKQNKITEETLQTLKEIFDFYNELYLLFYQFEKKQQQELIKKRYLLLAKIKEKRRSVQDMKLLYEAKFILDCVNDFYECKLGLELLKQENESQ